MENDATHETKRARKRRFHHRSRNSCVTCKARHVRCDERKPICSNCTRIGGSCGYLAARESRAAVARATSDTDAAWSGYSTSAGPDHAYRSTSPWRSLVDLTPNHLLMGLPLEAPYKSRWLFHIFTHLRAVDRRGVGPPRVSFVFRHALSHPALLHAALLLTTIEYSISVESMEDVKWLNLYHKGQLYGFVREQIGYPERVTQDTTMTAVAAICIAESCVGNLAVAQHYAYGLGRMAAIRSRKAGPAYKKPTLPWRLVTMLISCLAYDLSEESSWVDTRSDTFYQPMLVGMLFKASWPAYVDTEVAIQRQAEWITGQTAVVWEPGPDVATQATISGSTVVGRDSAAASRPLWEPVDMSVAANAVDGGGVRGDDGGFGHVEGGGVDDDDGSPADQISVFDPYPLTHAVPAVVNEQTRWRGSLPTRPAGAAASAATRQGIEAPTSATEADPNRAVYPSASSSMFSEPFATASTREAAVALALSSSSVRSGIREPFVPPSYPHYGWWQRTGARTERLFRAVYVDSTSGRLRAEASATATADHDPRNPRLVGGSSRRTRVIFMACFTYLVQAMHRVPLDRLVASWLLEALLDDLDRTRDEMVDGRCGREAWLLVALLGLAIVADAERRVIVVPSRTATRPSGPPSPSSSSSFASSSFSPPQPPPASSARRDDEDVGSDEAAELALWHRRFADRVRLASRVLGVAGDWDGAVRALRHFAWASGWDGEDEVRALWEAAMEPA